MSFLDSFSAGGAKQRVYMSLTPGVGLEIIQLDLKGGVVANYAVRDLEYNEQSRDIPDYDYFKAVVSDLFQELGISPKCEVVLNLPMVVFGTTQLGLLLSNESIAGAIQSEVEQTYIFRRLEPVIAWQDVPTGVNNAVTGRETRQVLYTALQQTVVDSLKSVFEELGATLVKIEVSLTSTLRALDYMGVVSEQMQPNMIWNLMIINSVGYSVVSMAGKNVIDYIEEPLATKSLEGDEIYNAIAQSLQITLMSNPANYLFIVSDTDQVSAELLLSRLSVPCSVSVLENNNFKRQDSLIPVGLNVLQKYASKISLQAIGCALADDLDFPLKFDFFATSGDSLGDQMCKIPLGEHDIIVSKASAVKYTTAISGVLLSVFFLIGFVLLPKVVEASSAKTSKVTADLEALNKQIESYTSTTTTETFDLKNSVEAGIKSNRAKLMNYVAIGDAVPKNVWLTYFMTQGNGLVDVKGVSSNVSDVYVFFKNLRDSLLGTQLKLQKLDMDAASVDAAISGLAPANYEFEITNMTTDQLSALQKSLEDSNSDKKQDGDSNNNNSKNNNSASNSSSGSTDSNPPSNGLLGSEPVKK